LYTFAANHLFIIARELTINHQFIRENRQRAADFTELKCQISGSQVTIWIGCEPFGVDDPTPKLTFYLPEEHYAVRPTALHAAVWGGSILNWKAVWEISFM
jgi:hypothetical protein